MEGCCVTYESLAAFYAADRRRGRAYRKEYDFGCWWQGETQWPLWRVSWNPGSGDVYAVTYGDGPRVHVLGHVPSDAGEDYAATIHSVLAGWEYERRLDWVKARLQRIS
jgi:hypothetical protein